MAIQFVHIQIALAALAFFCSSFIVLRLAPQTPWIAPALRATLVLAIAVADLLYSALHLTAAVLELTSDDVSADRRGSALCPFLGPLLYFSIFAVYITITMLSHYNFYRMTRRKAERSRLLWRYMLGGMAADCIFTAIVAVAATYGHGGFKMSYGYCVAWQPNFMHYGEACFLLSLFITVYMGCKARRQHSPIVFYRQQGNHMVIGYICVALCVGMWQMVLLVWRCGESIPEDSYMPRALVIVYVVLNLLWPVGNFIVFTVAAKPTLVAEARERGLLGVSVPNLRCVGFAKMDSAGQSVSNIERRDSAAWRRNSELQIEATRCDFRIEVARLIDLQLPPDVPMRNDFLRAAVIDIAHGGVEAMRTVVLAHARGRSTLRRKLLSLWQELYPEEQAPFAFTQEDCSEDSGTDESGMATDDDNDTSDPAPPRPLSPVPSWLQPLWKATSVGTLGLDSDDDDDGVHWSGVCDVYQAC